MDRTGQTLLGKYELTRVLGKGGMGEVWEGEHTLTGRKVAVKILAENYLANRKVVARFGREARAASSVQHTGIVEILDQDRTDDGVPFLVMEFLEGESVGERIRKLGKLGQDEALAIMLPLLDALDSAHQAGVVHRDLKPDNVFILPGPRGEERIKILDFGISQKADEIEHGLTQEGSVLGTPHYMSPEQARGEAGIDARVDVYASGVMFYECLVGDVPFDAGNYNALLQIILGTPPPSPRSRGADVSPAVEQVLLAAMDKKRDRRPPSARVFHDLLLEASVQEDDAVLDTKTWTFSTPSEPPPPLDFGPEESSHGGVELAFEPPRRSVRAQPQAATFGDTGELEADLFHANSPARGLPQQSPRLTPHRPENNQHKPLVVPPPQRGPVQGVPPPPSYDHAPMQPRTFEAPMPRANHDSPRGPLDTGRTAFEAAPSYQRGGPMIDPVPRMASSRPGHERQRANFAHKASEVDKPGLGRSVMNWVAVLLVLGALAYLVRVISDRPDPRKRRHTESGQGEPAGPGTTERAVD